MIKAGMSRYDRIIRINGIGEYHFGICDIINQSNFKGVSLRITFYISRRKRGKAWFSFNYLMAYIFIIADSTAIFLQNCVGRASKIACSIAWIVISYILPGKTSGLRHADCTVRAVSFFVMVCK